jgi:hypothetical protein
MTSSSSSSLDPTLAPSKSLIKAVLERRPASSKIILSAYFLPTPLAF